MALASGCRKTSILTHEPILTSGTFLSRRRVRKPALLGQELQLLTCIAVAAAAVDWGSYSSVGLVPRQGCGRTSRPPTERMNYDLWHSLSAIDANIGRVRPYGSKNDSTALYYKNFLIKYSFMLK